MLFLNVLLLAAGKSSRIASIANGLPKPLLPVAGEPIIFRNLRWISGVPFINSVWINLHYQYELIRNEIIKNAFKFPALQLQFAYEKNILGTAGALANIAPSLPKKSHVLIIYSDNLFNFDLNELIKVHYAKKNLVTIALFDERKSLNTGITGGKVLLDNHYSITEFVEGESCFSSHYVNAGVYLLAPEIISYIPSQQFCDFGKDIFPKLLLENVPLNGYIINGYCLGLDTPACFAVANKLINQKEVTLL